MTAVPPRLYALFVGLFALIVALMFALLVTIDRAGTERRVFKERIAGLESRERELQAEVALWKPESTPSTFTVSPVSIPTHSFMHGFMHAGGVDSAGISRALRMDSQGRVICAPPWTR